MLCNCQIDLAKKNYNTNPNPKMGTPGTRVSTVAKQGLYPQKHKNKNAKILYTIIFLNQQA